LWALFLTPFAAQNNHLFSLILLRQRTIVKASSPEGGDIIQDKAKVNWGEEKKETHLPPPPAPPWMSQQSNDRND